MNNIICTTDIKVHCYSTINEMHREATSSCCTAGIVLEPLSRATDSRIIASMHHKLCYNLQVKIVPLCFHCIPLQTEEGRNRECLTNIKHVPTVHFQVTIDPCFTATFSIVMLFQWTLVSTPILITINNQEKMRKDVKVPFLAWIIT